MTRHDTTVTRRLFLKTSAVAGGGLMIGGFVPGLTRKASAAGVFEPAFGLVLRPEIAALSMSGSSIIVAVNALALKLTRLPSPAQPRTATPVRDAGPAPSATG